MTFPSPQASTLLKTGIIGSLIAALCCFTPVLLALFSTLGLTAWIAHIDTVLIPALVFFLALSIYAFIQQDKQGDIDDKT